MPEVDPEPEAAALDLADGLRTVVCIQYYDARFMLLIAKFISSGLSGDSHHLNPMCKLFLCRGVRWRCSGRGRRGGGRRCSERDRCGGGGAHACVGPCAAAGDGKHAACGSPAEVADEVPLRW